METQEPYFHLPPELRQFMLLAAKPPLYNTDGFCSTGPEAPHLPSPPLPPPPPSSHHPTPLASSSANIDAAAGDNGFCPPQGRWPRQETLTLLEIRTRLDPKFRESGQKAALWDEIARIMAEEYGYQRSGRKCREKLDNLYKYYKKTKEGKAGRQDGKHYRFFRQLEALYGGAASAVAIPIKLESTSFNCRPGILESMEGVCFSTSTESSGEEAGCEEEVEEGVLVEGSGSSRRRRTTRPRMADLIDAQLKRLVDMQGAWFEKMLQSMERMEEERLRREEAWRREEAARQERSGGALRASGPGGRLGRLLCFGRWRGL
ncbi:hypothetical protein HPP92_002059 [Vanilla planifolia]|uniref:Myb-like domain-containing protein n=1 Tax=Vanilla planifolia TaxID=51239 RepID=A0A835RV62_VANPL|nr:hypothetical protein HPP92_002059 [Vanilla planifolia]